MHTVLISLVAVLTISMSAASAQTTKRYLNISFPRSANDTRYTSVMSALDVCGLQVDVHHSGRLRGTLTVFGSSDSAGPYIEEGHFDFGPGPPDGRTTTFSKYIFVGHTHWGMALTKSRDGDNGNAVVRVGVTEIPC